MKSVKDPQAPKAPRWERASKKLQIVNVIGLHLLAIALVIVLLQGL